MLIQMVVQHFGVDPKTAITIVVGAMMLLPYLAAANFDELELFLADSVRRTLAYLDITEKEAADAMRMDVSYLRRCLRGESDLSLTKMIRLPGKFWPVFCPILMWVVFQKRCDEMAASFGFESDRARAQAMFETLQTRRVRAEPPVDTRLRA